MENLDKALLEQPSAAQHQVYGNRNARVNFTNFALMSNDRLDIGGIMAGVEINDPSFHGFAQTRFDFLVGEEKRGFTMRQHGRIELRGQLGFVLLRQLSCLLAKLCWETIEAFLPFNGVLIQSVLR